MVAATYVRDIDTSRAFYELLGFGEHSSGQAATSAWSALRHGQNQVLLASTTPPLDLPGLPLIFYFYYDDVDAVVAVLAGAGVAAEHVGYPPHALGGELRLTDPDGNTVLIGQEQRSAAQSPLTKEQAASRFSLLKEAAATIAALGGTTVRCQVGEPDGTACSAEAQVKLADPGGHAAWACLNHADEVLVSVRGSFLTAQGETGLPEFLALRHS
jgi:catechol 2,3-dioxygenase-like lactoylglutathione lyase family enzyme